MFIQWSFLEITRSPVTVVILTFVSTLLSTMNQNSTTSGDHQWALPTPHPRSGSGKVPWFPYSRQGNLCSVGFLHCGLGIALPDSSSEAKLQTYRDSPVGLLGLALGRVWSSIIQRSSNRANAPLHQHTLADVVQTFLASNRCPFRDLIGTSHWEETPGKIKLLLAWEHETWKHG